MTKQYEKLKKRNLTAMGASEEHDEQANTQDKDGKGLTNAKVRQNQHTRKRQTVLSACKVENVTSARLQKLIFART